MACVVGCHDMGSRRSPIRVGTEHPPVRSFVPARLARLWFRSKIDMSLSEIASLITAVAALSACVLSWINKGKIQEVHLSINSRMDQLLIAAKDAAHAAGASEEKAKLLLPAEITVPEQKLTVK